MKSNLSFVALLASTATALSILQPNQAVLGEVAEAERFLIELGPGNTLWITEDEKWALRRVSQTSRVTSFFRLARFCGNISAEVLVGGHQLHGCYRHS